MTMTISCSRHIDAPVETVFEVFTDLRSAAERLSGVEQLEVLTDGPIGVGTRFRETRIMFKKKATEEMEITAFERNRRYTVGCDSCGCRYESTFSFTPEQGGTVVRMDMDCTPVSFMAKLMSPLGRLMAGAVRKCFEKDLDDLQQVAEGRTEASEEITQPA